MKRKIIIGILLILLGIASVLLLKDATFFLFTVITCLALIVDKRGEIWDEPN